MASAKGDSTGVNPVRLTLTDKKGEVFVLPIVTVGKSRLLDAVGATGTR